MRRIGLPDEFRAIDPALFFSPSLPVPESFLPRGRWKGQGAMHTFCDDYRQEFFWRRPGEGVLVALAAGVCTAPDFTVWTNDPLQWRQYQAWRSALVASYWQSFGVAVLPVVSFRSDCHRYVLPGSAWAVRGSLDGGWLDDLLSWASLAQPGALYIFGRMPKVEFSFPVYSRRLFSASGYCTS